MWFSWRLHFKQEFVRSENVGCNVLLLMISFKSTLVAWFRIGVIGSENLAIYQAASEFLRKLYIRIVMPSALRRRITLRMPECFTKLSIAVIARAAKHENFTLNFLVLLENSEGGNPDYPLVPREPGRVLLFGPYLLILFSFTPNPKYQVAKSFSAILCNNIRSIKYSTQRELQTQKVEMLRSTSFRDEINNSICQIFSIDALSSSNA